MSTDRKTLLLGLLLGNGAGLLLLSGGLPFSRRLLETAFPYTAFGYYSGDLAVFLGSLLGGLVFPAVLASAAPRYFLLWSLLPLLLLMLWITAGGIIIRHPALLLADDCAFPIALAISWGIASLPICLFRFMYDKYRKKPIAHLSNQKRSRRQFGPIISLGILSTLAVLGWYNYQHPPRFTVKVQPHWLSGRECRVQLIKRGTGIYVDTWLSDQKVLCKIDTGSDSVVWSRGLHVKGRPTRWRGQICDLLGSCVGTQTTVLPRLEIGSYEVTNIPTEMSDAGSGPFTPLLREADGLPLLGNPAFVQTVLTIDYKNAVMTIRPAQYDFSKTPRNIGDRVLEMGWSSKYAKNDWHWPLVGTPAIEASLGAAPFWCTLDTGAGGSEICLTKALIDRNPSIRTVKHDQFFMNATSSSAQVERLRDLNVTFPVSTPSHSKPLLLKLNGLVTPTLDGDEAGGEGVIGFPLMQRYRITIDYGRGRVLLEPYAKASAGSKQEKQQATAKQRNL